MNIQKILLEKLNPAKSPQGATSGTVLDLPVKICQHGGGLLWHPVIPSSIGNSMRIHMQCNGTFRQPVNHHDWPLQRGMKVRATVKQ
jgi:hypothetical protein